VPETVTSQNGQGRAVGSVGAMGPDYTSAVGRGPKLLTLRRSGP